MPDALTLRRTDPDSESFVTLYDHPDFGKIDVGRISRRAGNPDHTPAWSWSIGYATLPGRHWLQGTAVTKKAANRRVEGGMAEIPRRAQRGGVARREGQPGPFAEDNHDL